MINIINKKNKVGSNGMTHARLKTDCNNISNSKYLNVSISCINSCAGMAEWSTQSIENRCPLGAWVQFPLPAQQNFKSFLSKIK